MVQSFVLESASCPGGAHFECSNQWCFPTQTIQQDVYKEYIGNYGVVLQTIHKCKSNNEQFQSIFCKVRMSIFLLAFANLPLIGGTTL